MGRILRRVFVPLLVLCYAISGGGDYLQQVTGVIGGTVELVFPQNFPHFAKEIVLKSKGESKTFKIAEYKDRKLETISQFQNRLEILKNGMGLRIKNVSFKDSGMYIAEITLEDNTVHTMSFNLSLYDPVPDPFIRIDYDRDTCNVTLHCCVRENATSLSYLWKYSINGSDFQLYNSTSATIQVSLQQGSSDIEFLCTVWNPADQKYVSYTLKSCQRKETHQTQLWWLLAPPLLVLILIAAFKRRCIIEKFRAVFPTCWEEERHPCSGCHPGADRAPSTPLATPLLKLSIPETDNSIPLSEIFVDIDPKDDVPFAVPENTVKYSECFFSVHEEKKLLQFMMQDDKIELGDSEHPSISPDPEDSENEVEC